MQRTSGEYMSSGESLFIVRTNRQTSHRLIRYIFFHFNRISSQKINYLPLLHTRVEIKDVCLAKEMQRVMAAEAEATRDARAKVVSDDEKLLLFQLGPKPIRF